MILKKNSKPQLALKKAIHKINSTSKLIFLILSILGLVTFTLFIFEEAFQTAMFGTWIAQDSDNWALCKEGADIMQGVNTGMAIVNYTFGWIHPLAFFSYNAYKKSANFYIKALRQKTFSNAPELFIGEEVEFFFRPRRIEQIPNSNDVKLIHGKIVVVVDASKVNAKAFWVKGIVEEINGFFLIKNKKRTTNDKITHTLKKNDS